MMRKGVVVFLAGIGLLCSGIIATSDAFWGKQDRSGKIPIEIGDATTVDMREMNVEVKFSDAEQPGLRDVAIPASGPGGIGERLVVTRVGSTLSLVSKDMPLYGATLVLPSRIEKVIVDSGSFEGGVRKQTLRIEASGIVNWKGDADALIMVSASKPSRRKRPSCQDDAGCVPSSFSIDGGSIGSLSITTAKGGIELGDMANVGTIELKTGPEASLKLHHVADLPRVRIENIGDNPEDPSNP